MLLYKHHVVVIATAGQGHHDSSGIEWLDCKQVAIQ